MNTSSQTCKIPLAYDDDGLTPHQRFHEIAGILAAGILRLHVRVGLPAVSSTESEKSQQSGPDCLELSPKTVLSVHTG